MEPDKQKIKSGIVALVGAPNVGKSTLLNTLLGQKISIVSPKAQTTRNKILGILNEADYQIVLLDTPGLHEAHTPLNREMVRIAVETLAEVDVVLFIIDVTNTLPRKNAGPEEYPVKYLEGSDKPVILLLNKIDLLDKVKLLPIIQRYEELYPFAAIIPLSALNKNGVDIMLSELLKLMPVGPRLYPEDIPTDASERFIAAEIIREKIFLLTNQEIPYSTAVVVESFKDDEHKGLTTIHAVIFVEKPSQKGIIIGKGGAKLQQIGSKARADIETMVGRKVLLKLFVKVRENWTKDERFLKELGF